MSSNMKAIMNRIWTDYNTKQSIINGAYAQTVISTCPLWRQEVIGHNTPRPTLLVYRLSSRTCGINWHWDVDSQARHEIMGHYYAHPGRLRLLLAQLKTGPSSDVTGGNCPSEITGNFGILWCELTRSILMSLSNLRHSTIIFHIYSYSAAFFLTDAVSWLWRSQALKFSSPL